MRWPLPLAMSLALLGGTVGCRGNQGCREAVELELRAREEDVRQLRAELDRAEFYNHALSRELAAVRGEPGPNGQLLLPTEPYPVRSIRLGRGTAGREADCGGADALIVHLEPIDNEGSTIKAPGSLCIEVLEINKEGLKSPLSSWDFPREQLRHKWESRLFNSGYILTLPWKVSPTQEKLRVQARFTLVDGRVFETEKDITIRLLPEHRRRTILIGPQTTAPPAPTLPGPTEVLPGPILPEDPGMMSDIPPPPIPPPGVTPIPTMPPAGTPASTEGPTLLRGRAPSGPKVQLLRPVPMPTD